MHENRDSNQCIYRIIEIEFRYQKVLFVFFFQTVKKTVYL